MAPLVRHLDGLGYARFWTTEHHTQRQSGSPPVVADHIGWRARERPNQPCRAVVGSTDVARRAGMRIAASATSNNTPITNANVRGSLGPTPYNDPCSNRDAH